MIEDMHPDLSIVVPVCNEAGNLEPLAREIAVALRGRVTFEMIFVDDGSTDETAAVALRARASGLPELRLLRHSLRAGQSAALNTGILAARGAWIGTLDGDGQNDPADLPKLLAMRDTAGNQDVRLFMGQRTNRKDTGFRRLQSRIANGVRRRLLHDGTPDTGCGIKLLYRETFVHLPYFDHMHRFLPALVQRQGSRVVSVPVTHRPRTSGVSKYGMLGRLKAGIIDLLGVRWLIRRHSRGLEAREQ